MSLHRRHLLRAAAAVGFAGALPSTGLALPGARLMLFDPQLPESRMLALAARGAGQVLTAIEGDPMRFWRDRLAAAPAPISGVTRWSDFVVLSELARERRLKVSERSSRAVAGAPLLVQWTFG